MLPCTRPRSINSGDRGLYPMSFGISMWKQHIYSRMSLMVPTSRMEMEEESTSVLVLPTGGMWCHPREWG